MIDFLEGEVDGCDQSTGYASLAVGPVQFRVRIPAREMAGAVDCRGLWMSIQVKNEIPLAYGFTCQESRDMFNLLVEVPGLGPGMAMRILDSMDAHNVIYGAREYGAGAFVSVRGIGKKTSEAIAYAVNKRGLVK